MLHLDLVEHGGGFILKKLLISHASLKLIWESLNSMVICLIIICLVLKICETFFWVCWILRKDWSMIIVLRYEDGDIRVMLVEWLWIWEILVLKFVIPVACTYGVPLCDEVGAWFIYWLSSLWVAVGDERWSFPTNLSP